LHAALRWNRTVALQIEVARHPHVALAALVQIVLQTDAYGDGLVPMLDGCKNAFRLLFERPVFGVRQFGLAQALLFNK
jgi:hypothetical protein